MVFTAGKKAQYTGWLLNIVNSQNFAPLPQQHWTAIGCTENGKPLGVTVHSKNELLSYMQRTGCSELGKNTFFNEHPVPFFPFFFNVLVKVSI